MQAAVRNRTIALIALLAVVLVMIGVPVAANAADMKSPRNDQYLTYQVDGEQLYIGVIAQDGSDANYYCIEAGVPASYVINEVNDVSDSEVARRLAWLMDHHHNSTDRELQAAIGLLTHDRYDLNPDMWQRHREVIVRSYPALEARAEALWREAQDHAPASASIQRHDVQGLRQGNVEVVVRNSSGAPAEGAAYTVTLQGPAVFDNGQSSLSGVSGTQPIVHNWKATGAGEVTATVTYARQTLEQIVSKQDFVRLGEDRQTAGSAVRFTVRKDFVPSLSTEVAPKTADAGAMVSDMVVSGVRGDDDHWVPGLALQATGWYFDNLPVSALLQSISPKAKESAAEFLQRLQEHGYRPAAFGTARFTGPGQRVDVQATTAPDGKDPYHTPDSPGVGTWVWAFERSGQSDEATEYVLADVVTGFMEAPETNTHRGPVHVQSTVTEHSATVGSELSDTITVSGFPEDHGSFTGDQRFGFSADRQHAQVKVWWAGDMNDQSQDARYRPEGDPEPQQDEHHRLIGTWDYPAKNGTIRVGAGAKDAHGNPVNITAEHHGWYVFVWSFAGDDRVMPTASAYGDAWERTRVERFATPKAPSISTQVDPEKVKIDEDFRDSATVVGDVEEGAYVEFTAFSAVEQGTEPGESVPLLNRERVALDHHLSRQTVFSPVVRSPLAGLVFWKASVFNRDGDVLATHELGEEGEIVTVERPKPDEPKQPKSGHNQPTLAQTGSAVALAAGTVLAAALTAGCMLVAIRRRTR